MLLFLQNIQYNLWDYLLILFIIGMIAIFFSGLAIAQYRFITYSESVLRQSDLHNAVYFMPNVKSLVKSPISYNGIQLWDEELFNTFPIELSKGASLTAASPSDPGQSVVDAVVCGPLYQDIQVGEVVDIAVDGDAGVAFANLDGLRNLGFFDENFYRFDMLSIWMVVFYVVFVLIFSIGIPYLIYRKSSPIEWYRRVQ